MLQPVCNRSTIATYRKRSCSGCHRHGFGQPWSVFWHATHTSWHLVQGAVRAPYPLKTLAWSAAGQVQTFCSPCATVALLQRIANEAALVAMGIGMANLGPFFWHPTYTAWHPVQGAVCVPYPLKTLAGSAAGQVRTCFSPCATVALLQRIANEAAVVAMGMGLASLGPIFLRGRMSRMFLSFYVVMFIKDHIHIYDTRVIRTLLKSICLIPLGRLL